MPKRTAVHLALFTVSLLFGFNYVGGKLLLARLPPSTWALTRAASALALLALIGAPRLLRLRPPARVALGFAVPALFGVAINQVLFIEGLARTIPPHSAVLNTGIPIFTLVIAWAMGRERIHRARLAGILLSVAGVLFLLEVDRLHLSSAYLVGDLLTLGNAFSFSFFLVISRDLIRKVPALEGTLLLYLWGTPLIALWAAPSFDAGALAALPPVLVLVAAVIVLGATIVAYFLNNWALARVESSLVAVYITLQPLLAALFSKAILGTPLAPRLVASAAATIAGVLVATRVPAPAGTPARAGSGASDERAPAVEEDRLTGDVARAFREE
jgi:drug/metabolite transporter (DMT)-like permease